MTSAGQTAACALLTVFALIAVPLAPARAAVQTENYLVAVSGDAADFRDDITAVGGTVEQVFGNLDVLAVTLPEGTASALNEKAGVDVAPAFRPTVSAEPSYGLDRIDQRTLPLSGGYERPSAGAGEGVDVYVMDTGILAGHQQFSGRVQVGFTAYEDGFGTSDCNGHGTHVAGIIGGTTVGVAPRTNLIPVRVLNCTGSTTTGYEFAAGLDWVLQHHQAGTPAVLNMSFGGPASTVVDESIATAQADGIVVVAAAGNENADACGVSPARAPSALAVAASTVGDARAVYSNFGTCVDLFAPGGEGSAPIYSAASANVTDLAGRTGTSMAAPHVAGAAARYLSSFPSSEPAAAQQVLLDSATPSAISSAAGTPNRLLYVGAWTTAHPAPTGGPEVGNPYLAYYSANSDWLGSPSSGMQCGGPDGGCFQTFRGGAIFSSTASGVQGVRPGYLRAWSNHGREYDRLGYPVTGELCDMGVPACRQEFQGGWIVGSDQDGHRVVWTAEREVWVSWGGPTGVVGLPLTDRWCNSAMCAQPFDGAWIVSSTSTGPQVVPSAVVAVWRDWGREFGMLGMPAAGPSAPGASSYTQSFQGGTITVTDGIAAVTSSTDPWWNTVLTSPWLGAPVAPQSCTLMAGACYQGYSHGWVVQSPAGTHAVPAAVTQTWGWYGREYGMLGFPTGAPSANPSTGTYTQSFQGGTITVTDGIAAVTSSTDPWWNTVLTSPWLGAPVAPQSCTLMAGACYQGYSHGWVVQSPAGTHAVPAAVTQTWGWYGREYGMLGFPTGAPSANPSTGTYTQSFQGGTITVTDGIAAVTSSTDPWWNTVLTSPWLGAPVAPQSCTLMAGACYQGYSHGWVVQSPAGTHAVPAAVTQTWGWYGREFGMLGFPTGAPSANPSTGTYTQSFQGGTITVTDGIAAVTSSTDPWWNTVLTSPWLGAPVAPQSCTLMAGACYQGYSHGWVVQSPAGTHAVPAAVTQTWGWYGREYGMLGFPTGAPSANPSTGTYTQSFQGGTIQLTDGVMTVSF